MQTRPNRIEELRVKAGMSMEQLAERIGVSASTVNKLEKGYMKLTADYMRPIADALDANPADLLLPSEVHSGFKEDAKPFIPPKGHPLAGIVTGNRVLYPAPSNALSNKGIHQGDLCLVDLSAEAVAGVKSEALVVAQLYDPRVLTRAVTIMRQFIAPSLLITNSVDENGPSIDMTRADAAIKGVILTVIREQL